MATAECLAEAMVWWPAAAQAADQLWRARLADTAGEASLLVRQLVGALHLGIDIITASMPVTIPSGSGSDLDIRGDTGGGDIPMDMVAGTRIPGGRRTEMQDGMPTPILIPCHRTHLTTTPTTRTANSSRTKSIA